MNKQKALHINRIYCLMALLCGVMAGCAKMGTPSGGPRDVTPPGVIGTVPENKTVDFSATEFSIAFDEYVVLRDVDNNVLVSPPVKPKPDIKTKGRSVVVRFRDTLQTNTTYNFQFLNAIADFHEGNLLENFQYVFSTGQHIDSMTIRGQVKDALTLKAVEAESPVCVLLCDDTLGVRYQTRCNKDGTFAFNHIKHDGYKLIALMDDNKNLKLDSIESMAFADTMVMSQPMPADSVAVPLIALMLSKPDREKQRVVGSDFVTRERLRIVTQAPMSNPTLESVTPLYWKLNAKGDTLTVWLAAPADSVRLVLRDDKGLKDTLRMRYRSMGRPPMAATTGNVKPNFTGTLAYYDTLAFTFAKPFTLNRCDSILAYISSDSTEQGVMGCFTPSPLNGNTEHTRSTTLQMDWRPTPGKGYHLRLLTPDTASFRMEVSKPEQYGTIILTMEGEALIELLNEQDEVLQRKPSASKVRFEHLKGGNYRIRAVEDRNGDGKWTPGDYFQGRQPEKVQYFSKTLNVRENWDMEEVWNLNEAPVDDNKTDQR